MATLLNGNAVRDRLVAELGQRVAAYQAQGCPPVGLRVVLVGENPASIRYVAGKERIGRKMGLDAETIRCPASISQDDLIDLVQALNANPAVHGILVQMPLPDHISSGAVIAAIDPRKDVDGLHALNQGLLLLGQTGLHPCTPKGVLRLLAAYGIDISGRNVTVVGRSSLVGKPLAALLLMKNATVTICHSRTAHLPEMTLPADMVVMAAGQPGLLQGHMVKRGAIVIDVGINVVNDKLIGDVDFASVEPRASAITPVPGGVGPMTVAMLMENTLLAYEALTGCRVESMEPLTAAERWAGALGADLPRDPLFPTA